MPKCRAGGFRIGVDARCKRLLWLSEVLFVIVQRVVWVPQIVVEKLDLCGRARGVEQLVLLGKNLKYFNYIGCLFVANLLLTIGADVALGNCAPLALLARELFPLFELSFPETKAHFNTITYALNFTVVRRWHFWSCHGCVEYPFIMTAKPLLVGRRKPIRGKWLRWFYSSGLSW